MTLTPDGSVGGDVRFIVFVISCRAGKYMQMMSVLKPIAFDVLICLSQLFDYYLYAVSTAASVP